jgi:polyferredoxin
MRPAAKLNTAVAASTLLGIYIFYLYSRPYLILGIIMGAALGIATFALLRRTRGESIRRKVIIGFAALTWIGFFAILAYVGISNMFVWVGSHLKVYYWAGLPSYGTMLIPCTRALPEVMLGLAMFGEVKSVGALVNLPSNVQTGIFVIVPFMITALVFGRGFCGWICYFGGTVEACRTGKKPRWFLSSLMKSPMDQKGNPIPLDGLREDVKDVKYGIAAALLLIVFSISAPLVCTFCYVWLMQYIWLGAAVILIFVLFVLVLPYMTKKRWWCLICPASALINCIEGITPFRVKIDKERCIKCHACIRECPMYAITKQSIEASGKPNIDCIKCGKCIEVCPVECIDLNIRGTKLPGRSWFIPLAIGTGASWYVWFVVMAIQIIPSLIH